MNPLDEGNGRRNRGEVYFGQLVDAIPAQMVGARPRPGLASPDLLIRFEGEHEGVGKRPRLGSDVAGRMDFDARLLHHLPPYRLSRVSPGSTNPLSGHAFLWDILALCARVFSRPY
jgi:hypothetical protein